MLLAEYKRDMNENYLVIRREEGVDSQSYQVKMLLTGAVPGLLSCHLQNVDGETFLHYVITSHQPLSKVFEGRQLGYDDLLLLFRGFIQVMETMAEYLLTPSMLLLDPEYIYTDPGQKEVFFCYVPGHEKDVREQFQKLTEYLLPRLDHKDSKAVMLGYAVYRRALEDSFHLEHVKEEIYRYRELLSPAESLKREENPSLEHEERTIKENRHERGSLKEKGKSPWEERGENPWGKREENSREKRRGNPRDGREENPWDKREENPWDERAENPWEDSGFVEEEKNRMPRLILICGALVVSCLVVAAKWLGYFSFISFENLLAIISIVVCLLLLGVYLKDKKDAKGEHAARARREEEAKRWPGGEEAQRWGKREKAERWPRGEEAGRWEEGEKAKEWAKSGGAKGSRKREEGEESFAFPLEREEGRNQVGGRRVAPARGSRITEERGDFWEEPSRWQSGQEEEAEDEGETVVLSQVRPPLPPALVSLGEENLPSILLNRELTVIGKMEKAVDALIDRPTISRVHAKIRRREGEYYLTDLNSRNGTSVNAVPLQAEEERLLTEGDEVAFAEVTYRFTKEP